jgi:cellulose synthase/poly-beta-1,6-N-acetylglucosamine synthase-like glycosyltransferase
MNDFQEKDVGAVAGNVQVGNAHKILTQWQSIEYITAQNFDRRAYSLLNAITVVP